MLEKTIQQIEAEKVTRHDEGVEVIANRLRAWGYEVETHVRYTIEVRRHKDIKSEIDVKGKRYVRDEERYLLVEFKTTDNQKSRNTMRKQLTWHELLHQDYVTKKLYAYFDNDAKGGVKTKVIK